MRTARHHRRFIALAYLSNVYRQRLLAQTAREDCMHLTGSTSERLAIIVHESLRNITQSVKCEDGAATAPLDASGDGHLLAYDERSQEVQVICESGLHD